MGKITLNGKDITKPFTYNGKQVIKIEMNGLVLTLKTAALNSFTGTFSSPAKEKEFLALTDTVSNNQFENETGLTSISLPQVTTIGNRAFAFAPLTSLSLPQATTIGNRAFGESKLTTLVLPEVTTIDNLAFNSSPLTSLSLPKVTDIKNIGSSAFQTITAGATVEFNPAAQPTINDFNSFKKREVFDANWNTLIYVLTWTT